MFFTVAITVYDKDQIFLPRAVTGLLTQSFQDFEVIIVVDGETPLSPYDPHKVSSKVLPAQVVYRPRSNTIGFRERHYACFHTGPSATADIEGVLIHGAQGVRSLSVLPVVRACNNPTH